MAEKDLSRNTPTIEEDQENHTIRSTTYPIVPHPDTNMGGRRSSILEVSESRLKYERDKMDPNPVPYKKIFPLCLSRMAEGMIYSIIFPYINEMIRGLGVEEKKVGVWSAMAVSVLLLIFFEIVLSGGMYCCHTAMARKSEFCIVADY